ncbi:Histidinol-phosphate aminotransferase [bioreactor metagenome]|uniref:Histidinol-phosphate aminotransferase n=1 Tax=bioreactor metagenome TaxID=1076179 RepID=A0A644V595_9ZZZZ|nr:PLP-dependent aminotransferase family protein [Acidaminococcaceae bacterium]
MPINSFENYPMSWKPVLGPDKHPLYLYLAAQLEKDIKEGVLLPGTKLPPQRELADFLDINVSTITRAFKLCTQKGLLNGTIGRGTFVAYNALECFKMLPQSDKNLIEMGSMAPACIAYKELYDVMQALLMEPNFGQLLHYGLDQGAIWQKEAAVKFIAKMGYITTEDKVLPAAGGQNAIAAILAGVFRAGDSIGVDPLTYPGIKSVASMLGIKLIPLAQKNGEISEAGLIKACKNDHIKGVYIISEFQNPTVHMMSDKCKQMLAKIAIERNLLIIEDGIFCLFNDRTRPATASYAPENTVFIASFSKAIAPGLRLAYIVPPRDYYKAMLDALYNINLTPSPLLLELAGRVLVSGKAELLIEEQRNIAIERNIILNKILLGYEVWGTNNSLFRWLVLPKGWTGTSFEAEAYVRGVQVYAAERFAVGNTKPAAAVRIAVATASAKDFAMGLAILAELLKGKRV